MKLNIFLLIASMSIATTIIGCKAHKIQIIHSDAVVTNSVPLKSFNDENYIWEKWTFSTNRVDK